MKTRFYLLFIFYSLLLFFYPGDSYYFNLFAHKRDVFQKGELKGARKINPVPYLRSKYYPSVTAQGVYIVDRLSFTPIYEKNAHERFLPASTTKIITALVAFDQFKPDEVIEIKNVRATGQTMGLISGEKITVEYLLYGMLVHSGNDAAFALADALGYDKFIGLMNQKAQDLKMSESSFANPAGLDQNGNYSSPRDMALAARELLKNKYLSKIVSTKEITISDVDFKYTHRLVSTNKLLGEVQGLGGLKTGHTEAAGDNLVSFYKNASGNEFIIVILKSEDRFEDTTTIIDWIKSNVDFLSVQDARL